MNINQLLKGVSCPCGRKHICDIEYIYIGKGTIEKISDVCLGYDRILVVADENTFAAAGDDTVSALNGKTIKKVVFPGDKILVPDEYAIEIVTDKIGETQMIVGIGSGVIQDLCKYVSYYNNIPYVIVATAPSMDGYASDGAAMITNGMKETYPATLPKAIIGDTDVLKNAPMEMIKAGYGDIIGKYSALNDWELSRTISGEYFCDYIYKVTYEQIEKTVSLADGILKRSDESIEALMNALVIIGIMMSFAGSSRPASGSEHHLSHFFEITGILTESPYFSHGIDVAYSTVITAKLREEILKSPFPDKLFRPRDCYDKIKSIYSTSADGCIALQEKMGRYRDNTLEMYISKEEEIRTVLMKMPFAQEIEKLLALVEIDMKYFYSLYGEEKIKNAVLYAKDLKDRYTVLWMYYDLLGGNYYV